MDILNHSRDILNDGAPPSSAAGNGRIPGQPECLQGRPFFLFITLKPRVERYAKFVNLECEPASEALRTVVPPEKLVSESGDLDPVPIKSEHSPVTRQAPVALGISPTLIFTRR